MGLREELKSTLILLLQDRYLYESDTDFADVILAVCLSAVSTLLIPVSAVSGAGKIVVVFLRVTDGIGGSVMWPALYSVCSHWAPKKELGLMLALILR